MAPLPTQSPPPTVVLQGGTALPKSRGRSRRRWLTIAAFLAVVAAIVSVFAFTEFQWATLQKSITELDPILLFLLMAALPVGGFSIGLVYLVAGAKFGPWLGGAVVAAATACHLLLTHWISNSFLRGPLLRLLARRNYHLPEMTEGDYGAVSLMAALVPGPPYFLRNYLLALSGVPLRVYFWICLPVYVARSYVTIFLGDLGIDPSRRTLAILGGVYVLKLAICAYLLRRLRQRHQRRKSKKAVG